MENTEIMTTALANCAFPATWLYCFTSGCKRRDTCVRYQSGLAIDSALTSGHAVFPTASTLDPCPHFKQLRTIRSAWGFNSLFNDVRVADAPRLRKGMKEILGGGGTYYAYHHGQRRLTPEQQAQIRRLFARFGYASVDFEHYRTEIDI